MPLKDSEFRALDHYADQSKRTDIPRVSIVLDLLHRGLLAHHDDLYFVLTTEGRHLYEQEKCGRYASAYENKDGIE